MYMYVKVEHSRWLRNLQQVLIFKQALRLCLSANQYTLSLLLMKGQTRKRQTVQQLRIYISNFGFHIF